MKKEELPYNDYVSSDFNDSNAILEEKKSIGKRILIRISQIGCVKKLISFLYYNIYI